MFSFLCIITPLSTSGCCPFSSADASNESRPILAAHVPAIPNAILGYLLSFHYGETFNQREHYTFITRPFSYTEINRVKRLFFCKSKYDRVGQRAPSWRKNCTEQTPPICLPFWDKYNLYAWENSQGSEWYSQPMQVKQLLALLYLTQISHGVYSDWLLMAFQAGTNPYHANVVMSQFDSAKIDEGHSRSANGSLRGCLWRQCMRSWTYSTHGTYFCKKSRPIVATP